MEFLLIGLLFLATIVATHQWSARKALLDTFNEQKEALDKTKLASTFGIEALVHLSQSNERKHCIFCGKLALHDHRKNGQCTEEGYLFWCITQMFLKANSFTTDELHEARKVLDMLVIGGNNSQTLDAFEKVVGMTPTSFTDLPRRTQLCEASKTLRLRVEHDEGLRDRSSREIEKLTLVLIGRIEQLDEGQVRMPSGALLAWAYNPEENKYTFIIKYNNQQAIIEFYRDFPFRIVIEFKESGIDHELSIYPDRNEYTSTPTTRRMAFPFGVLANWLEEAVDEERVQI